MTTITQLTEIVNGSLVPSNKKLDGSLVQISTNVDNKLSVAEDGLFVSVPKVDLTPYYTSSQTESAISAAIAQAQLAGGDTEVDLSGYATKAELENYLPTADFQESFEDLVNNLPSSIQTKVEEGLVNYRTEAQISTMIENYVQEVYNPELGRNINLLMDTKVDKTSLESYQTDVTTALAEKASIEIVEALGDEVNEVLRTITPVQTTVESASTPKVNSIPLYTLNNNGDYVLCTPDSWLKIGDLYIPAYTGATIGKID